MIIESIKESAAVQRAIEFYDRLTPSDQLAVKVLSVFMLCVVVIVGCIIPATEYNRAAKNNYRQSLETLRWMKDKQPLFANTSEQPVNYDPNQSLLSIANTSSKKFTISFKRYESIAENRLSLWLDDTVFNHLVVWLELLDKRYAVNVQEIAVDRQDVTGLVNVRLVLQR